MRVRTHFFFSLLGFFLLIYFSRLVQYSLTQYFPYKSYVIVFFFLYLGSVFPDFDLVSSTAGRTTRFLKPLRVLVSHRGFFHSFLAAFLFTYLLSFIAPIKYAFVFLLAYLLHIFLDALTIKGVKAFWPFPYRLKGSFKTGSWVENIIFFASLIIDMILFIFLL